MTEKEIEELGIRTLFPDNIYNNGTLHMSPQSKYELFLWMRGFKDCMKYYKKLLQV